MPEGAFERFVGLLRQHDTARAASLVTDLANSGLPARDLLVEMVGAAQHEVGQGWYGNRLTVADEHAATAVADAVVSVLTITTAPASDGPRVLAVCAEGDWHALASRLAAAVMSVDGCAVTFLGPSVPAAHLGRYIGRVRPDIVALSCSVPIALGGLATCVEAAHAMSTPVIVGGRALGRDARRAWALGADLWAQDAREIVGAIHSQMPAVLRRSSAKFGDLAEITIRREQIVDCAVEHLMAALPGIANFSEPQIARTREHLGFVVGSASAAVVTGDIQVFGEFLEWALGLIDARGVPRATVQACLESLLKASGSLVSLAEVLEWGLNELAV